MEKNLKTDKAANKCVLSQHEVSANTSMIIASLPFPPLPVVAGRGEDSRHDIASGHDLLSRAIAVSIAKDHAMNNGNDSKIQTLSTTSTTDMNIMEKKMSILRDLYEDVVANFNTNGDYLDAIYAIYCKQFRKYMQLYPGCDDLRFWPMDHIDRKHLIVQQARDHLKAEKVTANEVHQKETTSQVGNDTEQSMSYRDVIEIYAKNMYEYAQDEK